MIPSRISFDQNGLGARTLGIPAVDTPSSLPALPKLEKPYDFWLAIHQFLISIAQGEPELQRYVGSFTNNIPIGFIQQVYAATKVVTANGNAKVDTSQSKFGSASGNFDGTNSYLSTPDSSDWTFGTGDFTIDFWVRFNSITTPQEFWGRYVANVGEFDFLLTTGPKLLFYADNGPSGVKASYVMTNNWSVSTGQWHHLALVRSGSNVYIFIDGVNQALTVNMAISTNSLDDINTPQLIGEQSGLTWYFNGWLDEFRVSKGIARWTSNFTPPSAAYTSDQYTVLLLHMDGTNGTTTFTDSSGASAPDFSVTASPTSQSIGAGATATYSISFAALAGYTGTLTSISVLSGCPTGVTGPGSCSLSQTSGVSVPNSVTLSVPTLISTTGSYSIVVQATDGTITHQVTAALTVGSASLFQFNVKGTATQVIVTLMYSWTGSGAPPQGTISIATAPSGSPTLMESGAAVYDRTSISVAGTSNTYNLIHRVTFTVTAPGSTQVWTAYVSLAGVSNYTVTIEVS